MLPGMVQRLIVSHSHTNQFERAIFDAYGFCQYNASIKKKKKKTSRSIARNSRVLSLLSVHYDVDEVFLAFEMR